MTIRIDMESDGAVMILHIAGVLAGSAIKQLTDVCGPIEGQFVLEVSKLKLADDAGVEILQSLRKEGAEIRGASAYIKFLINDELGRESERI